MFRKIELREEAVVGANRVGRDEWEYVKKSGVFATQKAFEFKEGLNVVVGSNGVGKSGLLRVLAHRMAAVQGGRSVATMEWVGDFIGGMRGRAVDGSEPYLNGSEFLVDHDGQGVLYVCGDTVGVKNGALDDDFLGVGILNTMWRGSEGEGTMRRMGEVVALCLDAREGKREAKKAKEVEGSSRQKRSGHRPVFTGEVESPMGARLQKDSLNDLWGYWVERLERECLKGGGPRGQKTILLDEPDRGLNPEMQMRMWQLLADKKVCKRYQIIVASHSVFALNCKGASYVEVEAGYRERMLKLYRGAVGI